MQYQTGDGAGLIFHKADLRVHILYEELSFLFGIQRELGLFIHLAHKLGVFSGDLDGAKLRSGNSGISA